MNSSKTFFVGMVLVFIALMAGLALTSKSNSVENVPALAADQVKVTPEFYNLGTVEMVNGVVTKEYEVTNTTGETIKLKKINTSCMCTQAKVVYGGGETKFFGMEGHGDANPPVNIQIAANETVKVVVEFDPAAHGPQGVGPFDRIVWLQFSDPAGMTELKFAGTVI